MSAEDRALRPPVRALLISQSPFRPLIDLQSGIPTGQPNSAVLMSSPMILRSPAGRDNSQSRTGSFPASDSKNLAGNCFICFTYYMYHKRYGNGKVDMNPHNLSHFARLLTDAGAVERNHAMKSLQVFDGILRNRSTTVMRICRLGSSFHFDRWWSWMYGQVVQKPLRFPGRAVLSHFICGK